MNQDRKVVILPCIDCTSTDCLSTREGMVQEIIQTAEHYPLIFVVVDDTSVVDLIKALVPRSLISATCIAADRISLINCDIYFGSNAEKDRFRGTVPVFFDPQFYRRAA